MLRPLQDLAPPFRLRGIFVDIGAIVCVLRGLLQVAAALPCFQPAFNGLQVIAEVLIPQAFAVEDMWTAADRIIKDVYSKIAAISTVLAGLMSAVAVIGAKMSGTQQKADSAWEWLKRVWLAWVIINGIGAFIAYVRPLFDGLATLE